jgi:hypothetical protein
MIVRALLAMALVLPLGTALAAESAPAAPQLKVMNYYPADAGWASMWTRYDHTRTTTDFARIASLGANTVRVIVPPAATGFPATTAKARADLRDVLAVARARGLRVQLTLFDWWHDYTDVAGSRQWVSSLLSGLGSDPVIALVELQNELPTGAPAALEWARELLPDLERLLPGVPRTLSASSSAGLAGIAAISTLPITLLEVVSAHYYGDPAYAAAFLRAAKVTAGRPLLVGEAGRSTVNGAGSLESQAGFFRTMGSVTRSLGLPPAAPWTLNDFTANGVPTGTRAAERYFGLRRTDGSWKPAATVVRAVFSGTASTDIDGGFEREQNGASVLGAWTVFDAADGVGVVSRTTHRTGTASICFSATRSSPGRVPSVLQAFPVLESAQVTTAAAWVMRRAGTGADRISLAYFDAAGRYLRQVESAPAHLQGGWEQLTVHASAPAGAAAVQVHLKAGNETGRACYDDVVVR